MAGIHRNLVGNSTNVSGAWSGDNILQRKILGLGRFDRLVKLKKKLVCRNVEFSRKDIIIGIAIYKALLGKG